MKILLGWLYGSTAIFQKIEGKRKGREGMKERKRERERKGERERMCA